MVALFNMKLLPLDVSELIPHSPPMRMIDRIVSIDDASKSSVLEATVSESNPFLNTDGTLSGSAYLELISQGAAAQHGYNLRRDAAPEEDGVLVGVRNLNVHSPARVGDVLTINVKLGVEMESLSVVAGSVSRNGVSLADAEITVWHGHLQSP
jgi:predicted hotdog family 3-hydroxylacyl-ACP dehydratase